MDKDDSAGRPGHVVITGGSSGIGAAFAAAYAERGWRVSIVARTAAPLAETRAALEARFAASGARIHAEPADVTDEAGLAAAIGRCRERFGPVSLLVASAGDVLPAPFEAMAKADFDRQIDVNLTGVVNAVRYVYGEMLADRAGTILIVSSAAGLIGLYGYTAYCASKSALHGFAAALRMEAKRRGVQVSICFPPDTDTPQFRRELALRSAEAGVLASGGGLWSADEVARAAIRKMERGRFEIHIGVTVAALGRLGPLFMPLIRRWADRRIAKLETPPRAASLDGRRQKL